MRREKTGNTTSLYRLLAAALASALLLTGCSSSTPSEQGSGEQTSAAFDRSDYDLSFSDRDSDSSWDEAASTVISLGEDSCTVSGDGANANGCTVTITQEGSYVLSGSLENGQILVDAGDDDKVQLVLNGCSVTCADSAALYIKNADKVFVTLADGTNNTLSSGETFSDTAQEDGVKGAVYAACDLTCNGDGALTVSADGCHGIFTKDDLTITSGTYVVTAAQNALHGKDSVKISDGTFTLTAGNDGIHSSQTETGKGFVYVCSGDFTIEAEHDAVQAEQYLSITAGTFAITTGGGAGDATANAMTFGGGDFTRPNGDAANTVPDNSAGSTPEPPDNADGTMSEQPSGHPKARTDAGTTDTASESTDTESKKGLKSGIALEISGGTFTLDCEDDAVHANGDVTVSGGTFTIATGDDGMHSDQTLTVSGGDITISQSYEGLEGADVVISDGTIDLVSSDDGINAAGGSDSDSGNEFSKMSGTNHDLTVSGGTISIDAGGDGVDSNGTLTVSGGTLLISGPSNSGNGALDYGEGCEATITGGTVLASATSSMAENFSDSSTQCAVLYTFSEVQEAGTYVSIRDADGTELYSAKFSKSFYSLLFSLPELAVGQSYTVCAGTDKDTLQEIETLTLSNTITGEGSSLGGGMKQKGQFDGTPKREQRNQIQTQ